MRRKRILGKNNAVLKGRHYVHFNLCFCCFILLCCSSNNSNCNTDETSVDGGDTSLYIIIWFCLFLY